MNTVGIVGGLGPESTVDYYQSIISKFQNRKGSKETLPELFINSINMYKIFHFISHGQTQDLIEYLTDAVQKLERVGADFVAISANTPHIVFDQVQQRVQVPMISIVEETFKRVEELGMARVGLIGTKFTMEHDFFQRPFISHQKEIYVPNLAEQEYIHRKIVEELENGIIVQETKEKFKDIILKMVERNRIEGIILGCTELPMIIKPEDLAFPQFNTTEIHVNKIVDTIFLEQK
ncbi:aspartate/glutamate racemase family protein [Neobacillus mesonae]|uniref:aspartate/glutamate racemase family protein n=1 Tax=Neobacillus mesonae TaxID=1193713 RepID=UPI0020400247|nr:amino acid racemase [Neobacillus mesonae]MCM3570284.1 amino acid racemase [Neobacillus mesonae]